MKYLKTIGFNSNQPIGRGFNYPYDTAFSADGRIFVMNRMGGLNPRGIRIQICTFDEDWLGEFSTGPGDGDDQFRVPVCMAFDAHDNLYVTDEALNEVKVFDSRGSFLRKWGTDIDGYGSLAGPAGVTHGAEGSVFVVEQYANRVHKLTPNGESITTWGESGDGEGQFNLPWGATVDSDGDVYIADWRNDRIQTGRQGPPEASTDAVPHRIADRSHLLGSRVSHARRRRPPLHHRAQPPPHTDLRAVVNPADRRAIQFHFDTYPVEAIHDNKTSQGTKPALHDRCAARSTQDS